MQALSHHFSSRRAVTVAVLTLAVLLAGAYMARAFAEASDLPARARIVMVAADGVVETPLPPPDPSYCGPSDPPPPPSTVLGTLTIGGAPAPAGTLVQIVFDGKVGPAALTKAAGGYRLDFHEGPFPACANKGSAHIGVLVNGQVIDGSFTVAEVESGVPHLFNVAIQ